MLKKILLATVMCLIPTFVMAEIVHVKMDCYSHDELLPILKLLPMGLGAEINNPDKVKVWVDDFNKNFNENITADKIIVMTSPIMGNNFVAYFFNNDKVCEGINMSMDDFKKWSDAIPKDNNIPKDNTL